MRSTMLAACSFSFVLTVVAQEVEPPAPAVSLERGAYAEEYERDFAKAVEHYELALAAAEAMGDEARVAEARAALERVKRRQGEAPTEEEAEALRAQIEARIGEVLSQLRNTAPGWKDHPTAAGELAVFGTVATDALEALFDGGWHQFGDKNIDLPAEDVALLLTSMGTSEADAAMERQCRAPNPLVRREVVSRCNAERHRALLVAAAADPVEPVRAAAIERLAGAPRAEDVEIFRAAARDGISAAVGGLYRLDPEAVVASALAPGATPSLRQNVAWRVLEDGRGAPSPAGARLLAQLAMDPDERWNDLRAGLGTNLRESWWSLAEETRAAFESEVIGRFERWPSSDAVRLLELVGGLPALELLAARKVDGGASASDQGVKDIVLRIPRERWVELARALNRVPVPEALQGSEAERARALWTLIVTGLARLPWGPGGEGDLLAVWDALDEAHRPLVLGAFYDWLVQDDDRRRRQAGGDTDAGRNPGMLPVALSPVAEALVRSADEAYIAQGLAALQSIGRVESLPMVLSFYWRGSQFVTAGSGEAARALVAVDPEKARGVIVSAIRSGWRLRPNAPTIEAAGLRVLPDVQAIAAIEELWPEAQDGSALRAALIDRLISAPDSPGATTLLVEHYAELPADMPQWRRDVIQRVGEALYEPGLELLGAALEDKDAEVRFLAYQAFQAFRAQQAKLSEFEAWKRGGEAGRTTAEELLELLGSGNGEVRLGAVQALGAMRAREALPALVRLLGEEDEELKGAVRVAIGRMGE